jgi:hypothetical protein
MSTSVFAEPKEGTGLSAPATVRALRSAGRAFESALGL